MRTTLLLIVFMGGCAQWECPDNLVFKEDGLCYPAGYEADADADADADTDADADSDIDLDLDIDIENSDIEVAGIWLSESSQTLVFSDEIFYQEGELMGEVIPLKVAVSGFSNPETYLVGQVVETVDDIIMDTWLRLDWMWYNGGLVYCMTGEELESEEEALALMDPTPLDFPGADLCRQMPWTGLTPVE